MKSVIATETDPLKRMPARFRTARATLFFDRFMTHFIKFGGVGIILAVFTIFVFIFMQVLPLMQPARAKESAVLHLPRADYVVMGVDEWGEKPFLVERSGRVVFFDLADPRMKQTFELPSGIASSVTAVAYDPAKQTLAMGFEDGAFMLFQIRFEPQYRHGVRTIVPAVAPVTGRIHPDGATPVPGEKIVGLASGESEDTQLIAMVCQQAADFRVRVARLTRESSLEGGGEMAFDRVFDLSSQIAGKPRLVRINSSADGVLVATDRGEVLYFGIRGEEAILRQAFMPFGDRKDREVSTLDYLNGGVSVVVTNREGINRVFSLLVPQGEKKRVFKQTKEFEPLPGAATFYSPSLRNKAFLIGENSLVSMRYSTTETVRWQRQMPFKIIKACLGPRYDSFFLLDENFRLHIYKFSDPHPEAGWKAFFGKIWYEGYTEPGYTWQTTGSTDDFEPKFSLVPLIFGTLKGTFYALIFSFPIALLAALYMSQFAHPRFKSFIKPTMEIMASLPSVVLGFLAALWLAPMIEDRVPSLLMMTVLIPLTAFCFGAFWTSLPLKYRKWIPSGSEWMAILPLLLGAAWLGWNSGPWIEDLFFTVRDPHTGAMVGDFRLWWPEVTGTPFNQRNSLVVGFMMGFAVIPIIFTIAEDALSNVPKTLISGSLALGASRWQTALRVAVPTAFAGIFSAMMIGLGRAVGETMIVVMATGNTPIMDLNIFSGMRTLSANIAVELPEAPYLGTLYRSLFLGALILFFMTFVINTVAELVRQRFRAKYRTV